MIKKARKSMSTVLFTIFTLLSIQLGAYAATQYYDKGPVSYNPLIYTDYGIKNFPYKLTMHEATTPLSSSRNVFYHESYGTYFANLYGGETTPDGIAWTVEVTNSYFSGSTRKLAVNPWNWNTLSMYIPDGYQPFGGYYDPDVSVSLTNSYVEAETVVSGDKLWGTSWKYTAINF